MNEPNNEQQPKKKNVFTNKNFTLTFLGALVSNVAALFYSFAVSFHILKITDNNALLQGLYLASGGLTFCIVTLFGGVISDRFNKAKIMYICDYLNGSIIIGFTFLLMFVIKSTTGQVVSLFIISILLNAIAGIFSPASSALLPQIVDEDSFQQAQSYFSILNSFQSIFGILLAGVLYSFVSINVLFFVVGGCYILSAISEMFIKYHSEFEKREEKLTVKAVFGDIKTGFQYIASIKSILALMICILFINFFFAPFSENFVPYFVSTDVASGNYMFQENLKPEMWSSFFSVLVGVGSLITGIVLSSIKQFEKSNRIIRWSTLAVSLVFVALAGLYLLFNQNIINLNAFLIIMLLGSFLIGVLLVTINVPSSTAMMRIIDKDKFGKVSSVLNIGSQGLIPLAVLLGGTAITYIGSLGLVGVCAGGFLLIALILFFNKPVREL